MKIAILGGTGKEGSGLGFRWAAAGHEVIIGSRTEAKGQRAAEELQAALPEAAIRGCDNVTAAADAEIVVLSVPYEAQQATLKFLASLCKPQVSRCSTRNSPLSQTWTYQAPLSAPSGLTVSA